MDLPGAPPGGAPIRKAGIDERPETLHSHCLTFMPPGQVNNPLHGITLETIVTELVKRMGWEAMADEIDIRCFRYDPSVKSSLQFLRKTPWARAKVEQLYLRALAQANPS